jgi:integrase
MIVQDYIRPAALQAGVLRKLDDGTWVDKYGNNVTRFGFHNFRHALATFLIEKGHDPLVVQRMLRHSHVDMTMHYTHNSHKRREAQLSSLSDSCQTASGCQSGCARRCSRIETEREVVW